MEEIEAITTLQPITEWLDTTHAMRLYMYEESQREGTLQRTRASRRRIRTFVDAYGINMEDFEPSEIDHYGTFEDFFTRAYKVMMQLA
ncbi:hypothetical protein V8C42DRAFT_338291 [Trichoderma barbatum]